MVELVLLRLSDRSPSVSVPGRECRPYFLPSFTYLGDTSCSSSNSNGSETRFPDINLQAENLERVNTFNYLGATFADNGALDAEMTHRIQSGWKNWKRVSGILCDRRISLRVQGKVYVKTIDDFRGACAVKGNVQAAGRTSSVSTGRCFQRMTLR